MILTTVFGLPIIYGIYQTYKQTKKDLEFIKEIKQYQEWASLEEFSNEPSNCQGKEIMKVWLFARFYELDPQKAIKYFSILLNDEIEENNFKTRLIEVLPLISNIEDKELLYDHIFDSILKLQKEYFSELQTQGIIITSSNQYYHAPKITPSIMKEYASYFNLTTEEFVSKNVLKAFMKIIGYLEVNESLHLKRIAELCRISEKRAHQFLMKLLEYYPELGTYDDFTMIFKPSKKIYKFEKIVDFKKMIYS